MNLLYSEKLTGQIILVRIWPLFCPIQLIRESQKIINSSSFELLVQTYYSKVAVYFSILNTFPLVFFRFKVYYYFFVIDYIYISYILFFSGVPPPRVTWSRGGRLIDETFHVLANGTVRNEISFHAVDRFGSIKWKNNLC